MRYLEIFALKLLEHELQRFNNVNSFYLDALVVGHVTVLLQVGDLLDHGRDDGRPLAVWDRAVQALGEELVGVHR